MSKQITITEGQAKLFAELLWDSLATVAPDQWTDYAEAVTTFAQVAPERMLTDALADLPTEARTILERTSTR